MVQYKKQKIKEIIDIAAIEVFSEKGYQNTKISDISQKSGVSVGNIYRYYKGKEEIFYKLISEEFISSLKKILTDKIVTWKHNNENPDPKKQSLLIDQYLNFITDNREILIILLTGSQGTKYEYFKDDMINYLLNTFLVNFESRINMLKNDNINLFRIIYEKHIELVASLLSNVREKEEIRNMIEFTNKYHVYGITSFLENK